MICANSSERVERRRERLERERDLEHRPARVRHDDADRRKEREIAKQIGK